MLHEKGADAYCGGMDIVRRVAAAYCYWATRDLQAAAAIAYAFTGEHGEAVLTVTWASGRNVGASHSRLAKCLMISKGRL